MSYMVYAASIILYATFSEQSSRFHYSNLYCMRVHACFKCVCVCVYIFISSIDFLTHFIVSKYTIQAC